jgi:hypothetical protein
MKSAIATAPSSLIPVESILIVKRVGVLRESVRRVSFWAEMRAFKASASIAAQADVKKLLSIK